MSQSISINYHAGESHDMTDHEGGRQADRVREMSVDYHNFSFLAPFRFHYDSISVRLVNKK